MNWQEARAWLQILFSVGTVVWTWIVTRQQATTTQLVMLEQRVALIEQSLRHVPSKSEFSELSAQMKLVTARLEDTQASLEHFRGLFQTQLDRMDEFLRRNP